jgi:hypothetical protein
MGYVLEEWVGDHNPYRTYPILGVGPFATWQEANEEAKKHQPQHGGFITVEREPSEDKPARKTKGGKRLPRGREGRRRNRR